MLEFVQVLKYVNYCVSVLALMGQQRITYILHDIRYDTLHKRRSDIKHAHGMPYSNAKLST